MDRFRKIRRQHWQERLQIIKVAKFECDLLKNNEDTAPQVAKFYRRLMVGAQARLPPTFQASVNFRNFISSLAKDVSLSNLAISLILRRSFRNERIKWS